MEQYTDMMRLIKELLLKIVNDIDTSNSNLSTEECNEVIEYLTEIINKNEKLSKYQACKYLKVSRATFDNYVRAGKIPICPCAGYSNSILFEPTTTPAA